MKKLLFILLCFTAFTAYGQGASNSATALTPTGTSRAYAPLVAVSNTSSAQVSLLGTKRDTIQASTLYNPTRPYHFTLWCTLTTPALSVPSLTITVTVGTASMNIMSGAGLVASLNTVPFIIDFWLFPQPDGTQSAFASITQTSGTVANLISSNSEQYRSWNLNPELQHEVNVTANFGGLVVLGNAVLTSRAFYKPSY